MKPGIPHFVVDSVEKATKFYTEKLGFDVAEISSKKDEGRSFLDYSLVKKNKCFIGFRSPVVNEFAEMSMLKHSSGRGAGVYIEMRKGLEKYFERCSKKGVTISEPLKKQPWGHATFEVKDPFGLKLMFAEPLQDGEYKRDSNFCGMGIVQKPAGSDQELKTIEDMILWLKGFGILRRAAKKYSKLWLKQLFG